MGAAITNSFVITAIADGQSVTVQYSSDKSTWHSTFVSGDLYMRQSTDGGETWTAAIRIVGESGANGAYTDYTFGISASETADGAPADISSWSDAPVATTDAKPYLWAKVVRYDSSGKAESTTYIRLTGAQGADGVAYWLVVSPETVRLTSAGVTDGAQKITLTAYSNEGGTTAKCSARLLLYWEQEQEDALIDTTAESASATIASGTSYNKDLWAEMYVGGTMVYQKLIGSASNGKQGETGKTGAAGADAITYEIVLDADSIICEGDGTLKAPVSIGVTAYKYVGDKKYEYGVDQEFSEQSSYFYGYIGTTKKWENPVGNPWFDWGLDDETTESLIAANDFIKFVLYDEETKRTTTKQIPIIRNGSKLLYYMAGAWDESTTYVHDGVSCPVVSYGEQDGNPVYWFLKSEGSWQGADCTPDTDSAVWQKITNWEAVYARLLFSDYAKLGSAIMFGDYLMSQYGKNASGVTTGDYKDFNEADPFNDKGKNAFTPNILMNLYTGRALLQYATLRGITAEEGFFGNITVEGNINNLVTYIDDGNFGTYCKAGVKWSGEAEMDSRYGLDLLNTSNTVLYTGTQTELHLPFVSTSAWKRVKTEYNADLARWYTFADLRALVGKRIQFINYSSNVVKLCLGTHIVESTDSSTGYVKRELREASDSTSNYMPVSVGKMVELELTCTADGYLWKTNHSSSFQTMEDLFAGDGSWNLPGNLVPCTSYLETDVTKFSDGNKFVSILENLSQGGVSFGVSKTVDGNPCQPITIPAGTRKVVVRAAGSYYSEDYKADRFVYLRARILQQGAVALGESTWTAVNQNAGGFSYQLDQLDGWDAETQYWLDLSMQGYDDEGAVADVSKDTDAMLSYLKLEILFY